MFVLLVILVMTYWKQQKASLVVEFSWVVNQELYFRHRRNLPLRGLPTRNRPVWAYFQTSWIHRRRAVQPWLQTLGLYEFCGQSVLKKVVSC